VGSINVTVSAAARFIAQLSLSSFSLVMAMAHSTYVSDAVCESMALWLLKSRVGI
jgi:hypothetical protein